MAVVFKVRPNPGRLGGLASAARLTAEQRRARSSAAGTAVLVQYGQGYFQAIGKLSRKKRRNEKQKAKAAKI